MKLITAKNNDRNYFLKLIGSTTIVLDQNIAYILGIPWEKYTEILKNNNAYFKNENLFTYINNKLTKLIYCNFHTQQDAENTIKDLEKYLIMATLTE